MDDMAAGIAWMELGRYEDAVRLFAPLAAAGKAPAGLHLAYRLGLRGRRAEAAAAARRVIGQVPDWTLPHQQLALSAAQLKRKREARSASRIALELAPDDEQGWNTAFWVAALRKDLKAASRAAAHLLELAPEGATSHYDSGCMFLLRGDTARDEVAFRRALAIAPEHRSAKAGLASVIRARGSGLAAWDLERSLLQVSAPGPDAIARVRTTTRVLWAPLVAALMLVTFLAISSRPSGPSASPWLLWLLTTLYAIELGGLTFWMTRKWASGATSIVDLSRFHRIVSAAVVPATICGVVTMLLRLPGPPKIVPITITFAVCMLVSGLVPSLPSPDAGRARRQADPGLAPRRRLWNPNVEAKDVRAARKDVKPWQVIVLGTAGVALSWVPIFGALLPAAVLACGVVHLHRSRRHDGDGRAAGLACTWLGTVALLIQVVVIVRIIFRWP